MVSVRGLLRKKGKTTLLPKEKRLDTQIRMEKKKLRLQEKEAKLRSLKKKEFKRSRKGKALQFLQKEAKGLLS